MRKFLFMFRVMQEMGARVREHKLWFLAPPLFLLVSLSVPVYYVGPTVGLTFIYAGV